MPLGKKADAGDYVKDFRKSDAPQFKGKSKKKRDQMAIAAYLAKKDEVVNLVRELLKEADPKKGTGKKPKGSDRRLYTDENPKDTVSVKFSSRQDIVDTLNKKSFKAKSHARQSQIINLIHQRVRAAYGRAKDPAVKKRLKTALDYAEQRKEASKKKTQRLKKLKEGDTKENYSELEQYRKLILKQLIDSKIGKQIRNAVEDKVGKEAVEGVYIIGSVLDSKKFHEESDIDIAVLINVPNMDKGTNEEMSYELSQTYSIPDGSFVDVSIWNRSKPLGKMVKLNESLWANINAKKKRGEKSSHKNSKAYKDAKKAGKALKKSKMKEIILDVLYEKSVHDPVKPGILKKRLGTLSCSKVRSAKSKLKNKGTHYAKALQRYLNYHCQ